MALRTRQDGSRTPPPDDLPAGPVNEPNTNVPPPSPPGPAPRLALLALALLFAYLALTRVLFLGLKPVQHDESMFAYYSFQIFRGQSYEFMPILHGPLLEWVTALVFRLLRDSDATMRLFPALCGVGIAAALWSLRGAVGTRAALLAVAFLAVSPTLLFFSRFIRNDVPFLFAATLMLLSLSSFGRTRSRFSLLFALLLAGVAVSIKETYVIFFFILLAFAAACALHAALTKRPLAESPVSGGVIFALRRRPITLLLGLALASLLVVAFYTSFFRYTAHWDGVWEALQYWAGEHTKHRIEGPYHFYLIHLAIYELPFLLFWIGALLHQFWTPANGAPYPPALRLLRWGWAAISLIALFVFWNVPLPAAFDAWAHMTLGLHVWMAAQLVLLVSVAAWKQVSRGRNLAAFADVWTGASLVIYSYAGEKVPWVTAHIALPMILACAIHADSLLSYFAAAPSPAARRLRWVAAPAAGLGLGWLLWLSLFVAFVNSGNPIERHTYASSHPQFHAAVREIVDEALNSPMGYDTRIAFVGEVAWPLWWYLRGFELKTPEVLPGTDPPYIILDEYAYDAAPDYLERYNWKRVRFRHYWQPRPLDWRAMRRLDLLVRPASSLATEEADLRDRARNEWLKLAKATFLRDENIQGPTRWDELGGLDAWVGRLKSEYRRPPLELPPILP